MRTNHIFSSGGKLSVATLVLVLVLVAVSSFRTPPPSAPLPATRPNVVIILADDLGYNDIAAFGGKVPTPNMDALGKEGTRFTQGYSTAPICSPSRAGLITGRYQQRFGVEFLVGYAGALKTEEQVQKYKANLVKFNGSWEDSVRLDQYNTLKQGLPASEITLAELFKKNGYQTGMIGKWHLGSTEGYLPEERGFDYHYGLYGGATLYADTTNPEVIWRKLPHVNENLRGRNSVITAIHRSNQVVEEKEYLTFKIAAEAAQYIDQHKQAPFLLYVPFTAPHTPFQAPKKYFDQFANEPDSSKRVYYGMIAALDEAVGTIVKKLKANGLDKNTIIFFSSDNGGATYTRAVDNKPLKGGKLSHFEGGYTVPFFIRYPNQIPAGKVYNYPVSNLDIFATAAAAAGIALPSDRPYDGVNLIPFVSGKQTGRPHQTFFWRNGYSKAVRKGDYKLYINEKDKKILLYDLAKDRSETNDIAAENPAKLKELQEELKKWESQVGKPLWPHRVNIHLPVGNEAFYFPI